MAICAIYARVSDEAQMKGESVAHQVSFMREFARRRRDDGDEPWLTPERFVYRDEGISGTSIVKRPAVQRLIADGKSRLFDVVLFKGISRFARDTVDALVMLRTLQACGLRIISFEENFDSAKDSAELIFTMHSAVAQYESEKIGIRVRLGNFEKARAGKWSGRAPDGYLLHPETKKLVINPLRAPVIEKIFVYYEAGLGCFRVAERLNEEGMRTTQGRLWSATRIARILRNPVYCGDVVYGRREKRLAPPADDDPLAREYRTVWTKDGANIALYQNAHEGIIDRERFARIQSVSRARRAMPGRKGYEHLLSGLLKCSCGAGMSIKINRAGVRYYRCLKRSASGKRLCDQRYIRAETIEAAVVARLSQDVLARVRPGALKARLASLCRAKSNISDTHILSREMEKELQKSLVLFDKHMEGVISADQYAAINKTIRERIGSMAAICQDLTEKLARKSFVSRTEGELAVQISHLLAPEFICRETVRRLVRQVRLVQDGSETTLELMYTWG